MDWKELGEPVHTLWVSIQQQLMTTKKANEPVAPAQVTLIKVYLGELLWHGEDPALRAINADFPSGLTVGGAKSILDLMYRYWKAEIEQIIVTSPDDLDISPRLAMSNYSSGHVGFTSHSKF